LSGCGNKTLLRLGAGNIKSIFTFLAIMAGGSLMVFTNFSFDVFLSWMTPMAIDFSNIGASGQDVGAVVSGLAGAETEENISNNNDENSSFPRMVIGSDGTKYSVFTDRGHGDPGQKIVLVIQDLQLTKDIIILKHINI
jgi:hypothetical protein